MSIELLSAAFWLWLVAGVLALARAWAPMPRLLLGMGCVSGILAALFALPGGTPAVALPFALAGQTVVLKFSPEALWLMGFGLVPAALACWLATPRRQGQAAWLFGASLSLIGALGVFGVQDGISFLVAWELMSLGGAVMILGEGLSARAGRPVLFMLGLLEIGAVALLAAFLLLNSASGGISFTDFAASASSLPGALPLFAGLLLLLGFGAKLGLLPFYEWFPGAYGAGSGASGALLSGVVMNAAFFGLSRGLLEWLPRQGTSVSLVLGIAVVTMGVLSAVLAILYAFQQGDWRRLLAFSSAENASVAVTMLGAALLFRHDGLNQLAALAWAVSVLHMAAHALAKGGLFLAADGVYRSDGSYAIAQSGLLKRSGWMFGVGALFCAMSFAALPPQGGFVSEWFVFQTVFQSFHLTTLSGRLTLALAGAGLALTAAIALATFVKAMGIGLLGDGSRTGAGVPWTVSAAVALLGLGVLALGVGMPLWLGALDQADWARFGVDSAAKMHVGWLLVPLSAKFAFISPSLLVIIMPLLALIPLGLLLTGRRFPVRRVRVWYGGLRENPHQVATTALSFANALRTSYSFIYRPTLDVSREHQGLAYFVKRLVFNYEVAPVFGRYLFSPVTRAVWFVAGKLRTLQSGNLNFYLALIGALLIVILGLTLV